MVTPKVLDPSPRNSFPPVGVLSNIGRHEFPDVVGDAAHAPLVEPLSFPVSAAVGLEGLVHAVFTVSETGSVEEGFQPVGTTGLQLSPPAIHVVGTAHLEVACGGHLDDVKVGPASHPELYRSSSVALR